MSSNKNFNPRQGTCSVCGRLTVLRKSDGAVGYHGDGRYPPGPCDGWGKQPNGTVARVDQDIVAEVIRKFDWDDYGMDCVDPNSQYAEWVPDLAKAIAEALKVGAP